MEDENCFKLDYFRCKDEENAIGLVAEFFDISYKKLYKYLKSIDYTEYSSIDVVREFGIDFNKEYQQNIKVNCRHGISCFDELKSVKMNGLMNLRDVLNKQTPLKIFLQENEIEINVTNRVISIKGKKYEILNIDEICKDCKFKEYLCKGYNGVIQLKGCDYRKCMNRLYLKLYSDNCETEVFLDGEDSDIQKYSIIRYHPEILTTLDNINKKLENEIDLGFNWRNKRNNKFYIIEFFTDIDNLNVISKGKSLHEYSSIMDVLDYYGYDYYDYMKDGVSNIFYKNLTILMDLMYKAKYMYIDNKYDQLSASTIVKNDDINIVTGGIKID